MGGVDLCMEYTGTMWLTHTGHQFDGESPVEMFGKVDISLTSEFVTREDGLGALEQLYGFTFADGYVHETSAGGQKQMLIDGQVDATVAFGTDPEIAVYGWQALQDDKAFWPPYDLAANTRIEVLKANQGLKQALQELLAAFPGDPAIARDEMTELNAEVDINGNTLQQAAEAWLSNNGLIQ